MPDIFSGGNHPTILQWHLQKEKKKDTTRHNIFVGAIVEFEK